LSDVHIAVADSLMDEPIKPGYGYRDAKTALCGVFRYACVRLMFSE